MNSDFWTSDFEKANKLLKSISEEVFKCPTYHKGISGREIALTRGRITQLDGLLVHLTNSLEPVKRGLPFPLSNSDVSRREDALKKLLRDFKKCRSRFYEAITADSVRDVESQADTDASCNSSNGEELVLKGEESTQLDYILGTVTNLKDLGYEINEEIDVHCRLIEDIESKEDEILSKTRYNQKRFAEFLKAKNSSLTCLWTFVLVLFVLFVLALIY